MPYNDATLFLELFTQGKLVEAKTFAETVDQSQLFSYIPENLEASKWLLENFPGLDPHQHADLAFYSACREGYFEYVKWFLERFPDTVPTSGGFVIAAICSYGHLEMAQWFFQKYPSLLGSNCIPDCFLSACARGHLDMAKFLIEKRPDIDVHTFDDDALFYSCVYNHLSVVDWLLSTFEGFDHAEMVKAFEETATMGRVGMCEFLLEKKPNLREDINKERIYKYLVSRSWIEHMRWFLEKFPETNL